MASGIAHRDWRIERAEYDTDQDFNLAVQQELALSQHIMERLGVAIVAAPSRRRGEFGGWFTDAVIFKTASVPAAVTDPAPDEPPEAMLDGDHRGSLASAA